ncbi:hypothetical protein [Paludibacterium paludis]|nr:hypothetical protein [Paludibacterium paludis]
MNHTHSRACRHSACLSVAAICMTVFYWQLDSLPQKLLLGAIQATVLITSFLLQRSQRQYEACIDIHDWTITRSGLYEHRIEAIRHKRGNVPSVTVYRVEHPGRLRRTGCLDELDAEGNIILHSRTPLQGVVVVKF